MKSIRYRDTQPEKLFRRALIELGIRYRLCVKDLPGKPDIVISKRKIAIFVNGCFWHRHKCKRGSYIPNTNRAYWDDKFSKTAARQEKQIDQLEKDGWQVNVVWECQLKSLESAIIVASRIINETR